MTGCRHVSMIRQRRGLSQFKRGFSFFFLFGIITSVECVYLTVCGEQTWFVISILTNGWEYSDYTAMREKEIVKQATQHVSIKVHQHQTLEKGLETEIPLYEQMLVRINNNSREAGRSLDCFLNSGLWQQQDINGGDGVAVTKYLLCMCGFVVKVWIPLLACALYSMQVPYIKDLLCTVCSWAVLTSKMKKIIKTNLKLKIILIRNTCHIHTVSHLFSIFITHTVFILYGLTPDVSLIFYIPYMLS